MKILFALRVTVLLFVFTFLGLSRGIPSLPNAGGSSKSPSPPEKFTNRHRLPRSAFSDYFIEHGDLYPGELLDGPKSLPVTLDDRLTRYEQSKTGKRSNVLLKDP